MTSRAPVPLPPPDKLEQQILNTYFYLRAGIAGLAFAFPIMLYTRGRIVADLPLQNSMSAYYFAGHGEVRDFFVGVLWAVGAFLVLYHGYGWLENLLLDAAGLLAIGIAVLPTNIHHDAHNVCAIGFFVCIVLVCIFCAHDTLPLLDDPPKQRLYATIYWIIAAVMLGSIVAVYVLRSGLSHYVFLAEFFGIYSFSAYWIAKTLEIQTSEADRHAIRGGLKREMGKVVAK